MPVTIFGTNSEVTKKNNVNKSYVDSKFINLVKTLETKLDKNITQDLNMNGYRINSLVNPTHVADAVNKYYVDTAVNKIERDLILKANRDGDSMAGDLDMDNHKIINVVEPAHEKDAATKEYVDTTISSAFILSNTGLIPHLVHNVDSTGYIVNASSEFTSENMAYRTFNSSKGRQWRVASENSENFWIQVQCLKPERVYKISIRAANETKLLKWKIQGNKDRYHLWVDLPFTVSPVDDTTKHLEIYPKLAKEYLLYRILVESAEGNNPGLSYWQMYTVNPIIIS